MWFISSAEVDGEMLPGLPCFFSASSLKKKKNNTFSDYSVILYCTILKGF